MFDKHVTSVVSLFGSSREGADAERSLVARADHLLTGNGYVYLRDVPQTFDHVRFLKNFGDFMPQYDGELVWDLKPEPDMDDVYHSRNTRALVPHTEAYEYAGLPPRYLALRCIKRADGPGGETTIADGNRFLDQFDHDEIEQLYARQYSWHSSDGLARKGIQIGAEHPVPQDVKGSRVLRYSYNNVDRADDGFLPKFLELGLEFFEREKLQILIERNCLLLWDNWRMLHSWNAFHDTGRHLKRVLIAAG